jgi:hypothetical protein
MCGTCKQQERTTARRNRKGRIAVRFPEDNALLFALPARPLQLADQLQLAYVAALPQLVVNGM